MNPAALPTKCNYLRMTFISEIAAPKGSQPPFLSVHFPLRDFGGGDFSYHQWWGGITTAISLNEKVGQTGITADGSPSYWYLQM